MARPLRIEFSGAVWHVTSRGNEKSTVFRDDEDRALFLRLLGRCVRRFGWRVHAYVLMGNHYHLLLETPEPTLSRGMRELNGIYTQRFNRHHERVGHLMQGRFKAILVEREQHLLELTRYVVLNPVRAGLVASAVEWRWSSYAATAGLHAPPDWLEVDWTLRQFGRPNSIARTRYCSFIAAGARDPKRPLDLVSGQIFLGGEAFRRAVRSKMSLRMVSDEIPRPQRTPIRPTLDEIVRAAADSFGLKPGELKRPRSASARAVIAFLAKTQTLEPLTRIGSALSIKASQAGKLAARGRRLVEKDRSLQKICDEITSRCRGGQKERIQT